jgi:hypothetical protein
MNDELKTITFLNVYHTGQPNIYSVRFLVVGSGGIYTGSKRTEN